MDSFLSGRDLRLERVKTTCFLIRNKFVIFQNIKIAKILLVVKIFRCVT